MTRTAGAQIGCQRLSRFWGLGCPKIYHEAEDTLEFAVLLVCGFFNRGLYLAPLDLHARAVTGCSKTRWCTNSLPRCWSKPGQQSGIEETFQRGRDSAQGAGFAQELSSKGRR
ncbi:hypothetical protein [Thiolapillus sp.]|uniref:hypothetical protein n=1 Tax=Thiolapillus sp. TaxID=2017437 RepID=UPI0025F40491|nr:hypothetical protein [Thiolapillus sp.]